MTTRPVFSTRIKELRTGKNMTLDQLASATGSSKSYIWELENKNPPRPSAKKLSQIASALGVTIDYLLGSDDHSKSTAEDQAFFRDYRGLPDKTREQIRQMAHILSKQTNHQ